MLDNDALGSGACGEVTVVPGAWISDAIVDSGLTFSCGE
jgi:hypothetical protein